MSVLNQVDARLNTRFLRALKAVTESHVAPELSSYCLREWAGETPWTSPCRDGSQGRLLVETLELFQQQLLAPPFCGNPALVIAMVQGLSKNSKIQPGDCKKLFSGKCVPKHIAVSCEIVFKKMREEGRYDW